MPARLLATICASSSVWQVVLQISGDGDGGGGGGGGGGGMLDGQLLHALYRRLGFRMKVTGGSARVAWPNPLHRCRSAMAIHPPPHAAQRHATAGRVHRPTHLT
jgi:hypothetical protein